QHRWHYYPLTPHRVGHVPGVERHRNAGDGLGQANEAERQGVIGELENLPADDDSLNLSGHRKQGAGGDVAAKIGDAQGRIGVVR
nr:hypothetical protein [Tanacetum cinerariifolium]